MTPKPTNPAVAKSDLKAVLLEGIHPFAIEALRRDGDPQIVTHAKPLSGGDLVDALAEAQTPPTSIGNADAVAAAPRNPAMTITLTEAAAGQIRSQIAKRGKGLGLRVGIKNVGCSGFAYTYELVDDLHAGDRWFEGHGARLAVDPKSLAFIDGSRFDFVSEGMNKGFKVDNPNVDSTCGCGESFNLKAGAGQGTRT